MSFARSGDYRLFNFDVDLFQETLDAAVGEVEQATMKAIYSTMAKTRRHARTLISDMMRKKYNISKRDLDERLRVWAGERGRGYESFEMTIKGKSVSLAHFGAIERKGNIQQTVKVGRKMKRRSGTQGITVKVLNEGKAKTLSRAWFQVVPGWGVAIRRRRNKDRNSARIMSVVSPATFFDGKNSGPLAEEFEDRLMAFIERTFNHELEWRLQQAGLI